MWFAKENWGKGAFGSPGGPVVYRTCASGRLQARGVCCQRPEVCGRVYGSRLGIVLNPGWQRAAAERAWYVQALAPIFELGT